MAPWYQPLALLLWVAVAFLAAGLAGWLLAAAILEAASLRAEPVLHRPAAATAPTEVIREFGDGARLELWGPAPDMAVDACAFYGGSVGHETLVGEGAAAVAAAENALAPASAVAVHERRREARAKPQLSGPTSAAVVDESGAALHARRWWLDGRDARGQLGQRSRQDERHAIDVEADACRSHVV